MNSDDRDDKEAAGSPARSMTYRDAGVDIDAGNALVDAIKPLVAATRRAGTAASIGGFGGLFDLKEAGYRDPLLVAATDGVGTKLKIAQAANRHDTIGIDLVAMCVNDLVVQGAEPLFFLDYFATSALDVSAARDVVAGIANGCRQSGCALIGGETAEMPGMYAAGEYDLAGFAVGAVESAHLLPREGDIGPGDVLIALPSSGVHSNGFSLVRKLVERAGLDFADPAPWDPEGRTVAEALLEPTRIYVKPLLAVIAATRSEKEQSPIKALAHITGGGLTENIPRVLPKGCSADIDLKAWTLPPVFSWCAEIGRLDDAELLRTFNCGIGMVLCVAPEAAAAVTAHLREHGEHPIRIGALSAQTRADAAPEVSYSGSLERA